MVLMLRMMLMMKRRGRIRTLKHKTHPVLWSKL